VEYNRHLFIAYHHNIFGMTAVDDRVIASYINYVCPSVNPSYDVDGPIATILVSLVKFQKKKLGRYCTPDFPKLLGELFDGVVPCTASVADGAFLI